MTLYIFDNDTDGSSTCYDDCAVNWPPSVAESQEPSAGEEVTGELGTTDRTDGTMMAVYNGQPLYFWAADGSVATRPATASAACGAWPRPDYRK